MATRQMEWQKKMVASGRCSQCGCKRGKYQRCDRCHDLDLERKKVAYQKKKSAVSA
jgi:hypothetical protein